MMTQKWARLKNIPWDVEAVLHATNCLHVPVETIRLSQELDISASTWDGWDTSVNEQIFYDGASKPHIYVNARLNNIERRVSLSKGISEILTSFTPGKPSNVKNPNPKLTSSWLVPFSLLRKNIDLWGWDPQVLALVFQVPTNLMTQRVIELRRSLGDRYI